jgi:hypothetical protein
MRSPAADDPFTLLHASAFNLRSVAAIESGLFQSPPDEARYVGPLGQSERPLNADTKKSLCSLGNAGNRVVVMNSCKLAEVRLLKCHGQSIRTTLPLTRPNACSPIHQSNFCSGDNRKLP